MVKSSFRQIFKGSYYRALFIIILFYIYFFPFISFIFSSAKRNGILSELKVNMKKCKEGCPHKKLDWYQKYV